MEAVESMVRRSPISLPPNEFVKVTVGRAPVGLGEDAEEM